MALIKCKECGKEISSDAKICPHCGKELQKSSILTKEYGCGGCLAAIVLIIILFIAINAITNRPPSVKTIEVQKIIGAQCSECETIFSAETTVVSMPSNQVGGRKYITEYRDTICSDSCIKQRELIAKKFYQEGRNAYNSKNYNTAKDKFIAAINKGYKDAQIWLEKTNKKIIAQQEVEKEKREIAARQAYAKLAREAFLDQGMDVKVYVHGPKNKYITLTYVLMGDVFIHNFEKSPMFQEIYNLGFRRVYYKDGYDFSKYTYWEQ